MTKTSKGHPSVLIVSYGLIAGEVFPIYLANALRSRGWPVAFLDFGKEEPEPGVRNMLEVNVPLSASRMTHTLLASAGKSPSISFTRATVH